MGYKGHTQGNVIVLTKPLPVPDGTEVQIILPTEAKPQVKKRRKKPSVVMETFGLIPADLATIREVLLEDLCET
ncbi:MAG TPA: hypothetical protein VGX03_01180 [Candidatus Binatia bacterium]|jgi:hypothetical protein|nr:hypothetical protein [Candidatus Binatia bacterium]